MVTSSEILKQARIKNIKTLSRWHQQGIIPPPVIRTHPSGRGKIAYWPDWVLGKCVRIRELQNSMPLRQAALQADRERLLQDMKLLGEAPAGKHSGASFLVGKTASYDALLGVIILDSIRRSFTDETLVGGIADKLKSIPLRKACNDALALGGIPVLIGDVAELIVAADFSVNHLLRLKASEGRCLIALPLLQAIRELDKALGNELTPDPDALYHRQSKPEDDLPGQFGLGDLSFEEILNRVLATKRRDQDTD